MRSRRAVWVIEQRVGRSWRIMWDWVGFPTKDAATYAARYDVPFTGLELRVIKYVPR